MKMVFVDYDSERSIDQAVVFVADDWDPANKEQVAELLADLEDIVDGAFIAGVADLEVLSGDIDTLRHNIPYVG